MSLEPGASLFSGLFARGAAAQATSDRAVLQAMLSVELALIRALQTCGIAPAQAVVQTADVLNGIELDQFSLGRGSAEQGTPVPALLSQLREQLPDPARSHLHAGATSQDIVDSALMLVARDALGIVLADLDRAIAAGRRLAEHHRGAPIAGRTLLQQALPTSFGLKAAVWTSGLHDAANELREVREHGLAAQLGGAVGTLAVYGDRGLDVAAAFASELGLGAPLIPWHTIRVRPARLAAALGVALGMMGKVARDVVLLAQTEVGEAAEGGDGDRGGSSTMPHKRNPVGAIAVLACAGQAPGLVATVLAAMTQEHERGAGSWQSEWQPLLTLLRLAGSGADALAELLENLRVDPQAMQRNLADTGALLMTESVVTALAPSLGRAQASERVGSAAARAREEDRPLPDVLERDDVVRDAIGADGLTRALDPRQYLGVGDALIGRVLAQVAR